MKNKKFWTILFSMVPGAGHMYLGLSKKGLQIMGLFFLSIGIVDLLNLSIFGFMIPIIWFYSVFDARRCYELNVKPNEEDNFNIPWTGKEIKIIGYIFIGIGIISIFGQIIFPMLDIVLSWQTVNAIKVAIISALFILLGLKLIRGNKIITDPKRLLKSNMGKEE